MERRDRAERHPHLAQRRPFAEGKPILGHVRVPIGNGVKSIAPSKLHGGVAGPDLASEVT